MFKTRATCNILDVQFKMQLKMPQYMQAYR
jgi:hypothetical protein